jgi:hypothetical protein
MKVTKTYTETVEFYHVWLDKWPYDEGFRKVRKGSDPQDTCFKCERKFEDGEPMSIAFAKHTFNKVLCHSCAEDLLKEVEIVATN